MQNVYNFHMLYKVQFHKYPCNMKFYRMGTKYKFLKSFSFHIWLDLFLYTSSFTSSSRDQQHKLPVKNPNSLRHRTTEDKQNLQHICHWDIVIKRKLHSNNNHARLTIWRCSWNAKKKRLISCYSIKQTLRLRVGD